jgi:UDP-N-acetylmuramoyl-tripeptide--D-alanyl-D-alanine ligase
MTTPLWTSHDLLSASGATLDGAITRTITGVSIDTRSLKPGDIFVALRHARDGHDFVGAAFAAGAAAALVEHTYVRQAGDGALLRVVDPLGALVGLATAARARLAADARVIAVTGSAGKTGTKDMLRACLASVGVTHAPEKSFNNHWGVPLTLARMPVTARYAVIEIGMNHAGEITPLTRLTRPHVAVVVNVLPVHVGNFADGEIGVAKAKSELFLGLEPGGVAVIPRDSEHYESLREAATQRTGRILTFGRHADADVRVMSIETHPDAPTDVATTLGAFRVGVPGEHIALNATAVAAVLREVLPAGQDLSAALAPLAALAPPAGRGARTRLPLSGGGHALLIDESYNANPASMRAALASLGAVPRDRYPRRIAVIGDMRELGEASAAYHLGLDEPLAEAGADLVFACGPYMQALFERLPVARRGAYGVASTDIAPALAAAVRDGDVVMIKGSLGTNMAPLVAAVRGRAT